MANSTDPDLRPVALDSGAMQIPHGSAGSGVTQTVVRVGEETIEIAPHPTTNRFPWAPVENPTIPIYQTITTVDPAPAVAPPTTSVMPVATPVMAAPPKQVTPDDMLLAVADELLAAAAVSPPITPPTSVSLPPVVSLPPPPPARPVIQPLEHAPFRPETAKAAEATPVAQPKPKPVRKPRPSHRPKAQHSSHIYSVSTREVWHVLRPAARIRFMTIVVMLVIFIFVMGYWLRSAAPIEVRDIPFVRMLIGGA